MTSSAPAALAPAFLATMLDGLALAVPEAQREAARAAVLPMRPADAVSAMLAVQMVAAHHAAMDGFRRAASPDLDDRTATRLRSNAASLARMMQATLRALQKQQADAADAEAVAGEADWAEETGAAIETDAADAIDPAPPVDPESDPATLRARRWEDLTMEQRRIAYAPDPKPASRTAPASGTAPASRPGRLFAGLGAR